MRNVAARLEESGRAVIALDASQLGEFAGNAIELSGRDGRVLALSARALVSLLSVRCMLAGIHLARR